MYIHCVRVYQTNYNKLMELVAELEKTEILSHGFGHNNPRAYMIYATKDLSEVLRNKSFTFKVRQV